MIGRHGGRFGIQWVASPRHADGVVITGPVTANMRSALLDTWKALPAPRLVIAVGACAISGGCYAGSPDSVGIRKEMPVDLFIPGCVSASARSPLHPPTAASAVSSARISRRFRGFLPKPSIARPQSPLQING